MRQLYLTNPEHALRVHARRMTPEELEVCALQAPWAALLYAWKYLPAPLLNALACQWPGWATHCMEWLTKDTKHFILREINWQSNYE
ncbi:MAG: hypothetical protein N2595_08870 [bacterium]|nr:hypothetical protein [bacterium]